MPPSAAQATPRTKDTDCPEYYNTTKDTLDGTIIKVLIDRLKEVIKAINEFEKQNESKTKGDMENPTC